MATSAMLTDEEIVQIVRGVDVGVDEDVDEDLEEIEIVSKPTISHDTCLSYISQVKDYLLHSSSDFSSTLERLFSVERDIIHSVTVKQTNITNYFNTNSN